MNTVRTLVIIVAAALVPLAAQADKTKKTARHAATTGADAVVDSGRLVGRTTKAFFKGGTNAAKKSAKQNAKTTSEDAKANGRATRQAAHEKD